MIIDSPIISGSFAASGSLNQLGNVVISGSLTVTGSIIGTASFAETASYLSGYVSPFPFTGSAIISGSLDVTGSLKVTDSITSTGTITAQTLVVQTVSSSVIYSSGSNVFGNDLANTQVLTGSVIITGSLAVNGSNAILTNQTSSMSASYAVSASYALNSTSASFATTSSFSLNVPVTASFANTATSASYALTSSFSLNVPVTASFANNATSASFATTASYLTGYISPFPFTGSAIISGSLEVTGSAAVSNLQGTGVRYLVADSSGSITAQTASAAIKQTQAFTSSANQTSFTIDNGYTTGLVDVFINGTKLAPGVEFTDTTGTVITLATGSNSGDLVEFVKYFPASGVTNNALRQQTTFTASAGQTVFSASYTPGLLDIFYNGSRLSNNEYTANNGTFFTLATGSVDGDILDVFVYSYQVGAFSGIGGVGVANQISYFTSTNAITSSPNFTISGSTMTVTGSLIVSGSGTFTNIGPAVFSGSLTSTAGFTGSFSGTATSASYAATASFVANAQTASYVLNAVSSSFATSAVTASYADSLTVAGTLTAQTLVVQTITSSVDFVTGSTRFGSISANTHQFTGSVSISGSLTGASASFSSALAANNLTGEGQAGAGGVLNLRQDAIYLPKGNGYSSIASSFSVFEFYGYTGASTYKNFTFRFDGLTDNTRRDYTLPDTSGTLALLSGSQTFNGATTFSSTVTSKGLVVVGASGGYTTGDNTYINLGGSASPDTFGAINAPFGDVMKFNSYHGYQFKTSNSTASPVTMFSIGINGAATFSATTTFNSTVGIGTSSPLGPLEVRAANRLVSNDGILQINTTNSQAADLGGSLSFGGRWDVGATPTEWAQISGRKENSNTNEYGGYLSFATRPHGGVNTERIRITSAGVVSINSSGGEANAGLDRFTMGYFVSNYGWMQTWASTPLYLNRLGNNVSAFGSAGFGLITTTSSDVRIKKNIVSIESALDKVNALRGVYFEFDKNNELEVSVPHGKTRVGLIAQEVETIIPEAVIDGDNDGTPKSVDYTGLVGVLVKAIQEQQTLITALEEKLERNNII
jgi:hypothetical protein